MSFLRFQARDNSVELRTTRLHDPVRGRGPGLCEPYGTDGSKSNAEDGLEHMPACPGRGTVREDWEVEERERPLLGRRWASRQTSMTEMWLTLKPTCQPGSGSRRVFEARALHLPTGSSNTTGGQADTISGAPSRTDTSPISCLVTSPAWAPGDAEAQWTGAVYRRYWYRAVCLWS